MEVFGIGDRLNTQLAIAFLGALVLLCLIFVWTVWRNAYQAKPLLNLSERRLLGVLHRHAPSGLSVMCQVSYGELVTCRSRAKYFRVNAKRADFVLIDRDTNPVAVVEYQGGGHFGFNKMDKLKAKRGDRQKRHALKEAGIALIEVPAKYVIPDLKNELHMLSLAGQSPNRKTSRV